MKEIIKKILLIIFSYISLISLMYITNLSNNKYFINNIILLILYVLIVLLSFKVFDNFDLKKEIRKKVYLLLVGILISFTFVIGFNLTYYDDSLINKLTTYLYCFGCFYFIYMCSIYLIEKKQYIISFVNKFKLEKLDKFLFKNKTFLKSFVLIIMAWMPILLAFYPGIFSYDSSVQLNEYVGGYLTNGNPVFHTIIVGFLVTAGHNIFGNYNFGVLFYSIFQMIVLALTLSYIINYLNRKEMPFSIKFIMLLIFMFLPTHSILAITTTKDVLFACIVAILISKIIDMSYNPEAFFNKDRCIINIIIISILSFLMMIVRHNGLYAFIFLSIFMLILLRKYILKIILIIVITFGLEFSYLKIMNRYILSSQTDFGGTTQSAALCIPVQQLGRTYNYANLSKKEKDELNMYVLKNNNRDGYLNYEVRKSDQVMWNMDFGLINLNKKQFLKMYVKYGLKYPKIYFDAFLQNTIGYWYIGDKLPDNTTYRTYIEIRSQDDFNNTNGEIHFDSKIPNLMDTYYKMGEKGTFQYIPILSLLMCNAFYNILLILLFIYNLYKRNYKLILPQMLLFGLMITNLLGPVSLLRYSYYLYLCFPLFIYNYIISLKSKKN